jgi:hypothetical protein
MNAETIALRKLEMIHVRDVLREQGIVVNDACLDAMRAYIMGNADRHLVEDLLERVAGVNLAFEAVSMH